MTPSESRWALKYAAVVMAVTSLPYLLGYVSAGDDWSFSGFVFGVNDGNSYIAKMAEGARGAWLFTFTYTSEVQRGAFVFPFFLLLGKLAGADAGLHEQLVALFHLARIAFGIALLLVIHRFLTEFLPEVRARRLGLVLASLGGGVGWVFVLLGRGGWLGEMPLEFYSPEAFTFLDLYGLPHLSAARACTLAAILAYLRHLEREPAAGWQAWRMQSADSVRSRGFGRTGSGAIPPAEASTPASQAPRAGKFEESSAALGARAARPRLISASAFTPGLLLLLAGVIQPLILVVVYPVIAAHAAITAWAGFRTREAGQARLTAELAALTLAIASPIFIYTALAFRLDPLLAQWSVQNTILSPHPLHYFVAYGVLLIPAAFGLRWLWRQASRTVPARFFLGWAMVLPFLLYAPFNLQRRLSEGFFIPLVTLALAGLWYGLPEAARKWRRPMAAALTVLLLPSSFLLLVGGLNVSLHPVEPAFIPRAEADAFRFLNREGEPGAVVLSSFDVGNALPAFTPQVAYLGHGPETLFYEAKDAAVRAFFASATPDAVRRELLASGRVRYVIAGPREAGLGGYNPATASFLTPIYSSGGYAVFEVGAR